jgi:hypothetical protein
MPIYAGFFSPTLCRWCEDPHFRDSHFVIFQTTLTGSGPLPAAFLCRHQLIILAHAMIGGRKPWVKSPIKADLLTVSVTVSDPTPAPVTATHTYCIVTEANSFAIVPELKSSYAMTCTIKSFCKTRYGF